VGTVVDYLRRWPDWPEIAALMPCIQGEAPAGERPPPDIGDRPPPDLGERPAPEAAEAAR
jgi:hypothetical protein